MLLTNTFYLVFKSKTVGYYSMVITQLMKRTGNLKINSLEASAKLTTKNMGFMVSP